MPSRAELHLDYLFAHEPQRVRELLDYYWRLIGDGKTWWQREPEHDVNRRRWSMCIDRAIRRSAKVSGITAPELARYLDENATDQLRSLIISLARSYFEGPT